MNKSDNLDGKPESGALFLPMPVRLMSDLAELANLQNMRMPDYVTKLLSTHVDRLKRLGGLHNAP